MSRNIMKKNRQNTKGFTLIELLVVIAIIALLMSIVMPALSKVKEFAKRVTCAANQGSIAKGAAAYANANDNLLPTSYYNGGVAIEAPYLSYANRPWSSYNTHQIDTSQPFGSHVVGQAWGIGKLYDTGVIDEPKSFYCPSIPKRSRGADVTNDVSYRYEGNIDPSERWPWSNNNWTTKWTVVSYYYAPFSRNKNSAGLPAIALKSSHLSSASVLGFDVILTIDYMPHKKGMSSGGGVNAYYGDGHVEFRNNQDAFEYIFDDAQWDDSLGNFNHRPAIYAEFLRML